MTRLELFQSQHGGWWADAVKHPSFLAGMQYVNVEKINEIAALTPEEIESKGKLMLAGLVGHLKHEDSMLTLHTKKEFKFTELPEPTYPNPVDEFNENLDPTQTA